MEIQRKGQDSTGEKTNICVNCQNACGGCSWSEIDPDTKKPRFEPVPGWTAKPVLLHIGHYRGKKALVETYSITACPQFIPDGERRSSRGTELSDEQFVELMKQWRILGWF